MKKITIIGSLLLLMMSLSGCKFEPATPDSLIAPPASNQEKVQQRQIISSLLDSDERLTVLADMENPMAYVLADLDHDKEDEMLAFYRNTDNDFAQGFVVLKKDQQAQWHVVEKQSEIGSGIDYFQLADLNNDGIQEILFGLKSWDWSKYLYVYQMVEGELQDLGRIHYDTLTLGTLDNGQKQIITAIRDTVGINPSSQINIYGLLADAIVNVYEGDFSGYSNKIAFTQVSQNTKGVYMAMQHNQFSSVMLLTEQAGQYEVRLDEPLDYDYTSAKEIDVFDDINGDSITEVCYLMPPVDNSTDRSINDYLRIWQQWDGESSLKPVYASLSNPGAGYDFVIPIDWIEQVQYNFNVENSTEWVDFFYEDEHSKLQKLFSIAAVDQYVLDENEQLKQQVIIMGNSPSKNKIYIALVADHVPPQFNMINSQLIACLRINGGK